MVLGGESSQDVHQLGKHGMVETYVTLIALIVRDNQLWDGYQLYPISSLEIVGIAQGLKL